MKLKIEELESRLEESLEKSAALQPLVPEGYRVQVTLLDRNERKKRKNAPAWSPESGLIRISFEKETAGRAYVSSEEDFDPIAIRGESLSATILRERR